MVTLTFLSINLVLAGGRPLEIVSDLSMGDLRSREILYRMIYVNAFVGLCSLDVLA